MAIKATVQTSDKVQTCAMYSSTATSVAIKDKRYSILIYSQMDPQKCIGFSLYKHKHSYL